VAGLNGACSATAPWSAPVARRTWWSPRGFSVEVETPAGFGFVPGQSIRVCHGDQARDYSISSAPGSPRLELCLRLVETGSVSPFLASAPEGTRVPFEGPHGQFVFRRSPRHAIFVATGTGFAPFLSMVRAGQRGFTMLHGVRTPDELFCREELAAAGRFVACVSEGAEAGLFHGRVTDWIRDNLPAGAYDFYLCGRREMVRDVMTLVDERFPASRVYTEIFF
jgi:benzoate/toluate 1,2-dioxygenase reductase component